MDSLKSIAACSFKEILRQKAYLVVLLFGLILLGGALIVSVLAQQERLRMILDLGLAAGELIGLVLAVFTSVNLILRELESRTVQLVLAHPVHRSHYILGRFLGAWAAVACAMALMAALHLGLLALYGWRGTGVYVLAWLCTLGKTAVRAALALLLSLALSSPAAAMAFTLFLWMLGHFTAEMRFLAERSGSFLLKWPLLLAAFTTPDLARFDYRDFWSAAPGPGASWFLWLALYTAAYVSTALALSCQLFSQKEV